MATIHKIDTIKLEENFSISYDLGYKQLDSCLNGLKEGTIVTIGARPAMGKTVFLNNIVINLLEHYNLPTLYVSLEASKELLTLQLSTIISEISYKEVKNNEIKAKESIDKFISKKYNLYISEDCYSISNLEELIENNKDIKFLIIDYIQLMNNEKEFLSATDQYNDILDRIKILAIKYKLVIFLSSQISRNVEYRQNNRPMLVDLRQSGNIENNSDVIMFLYRESYYNTQIKNNTTEIIISKNRYGCTGIVYLEYNENKSKFIDY